jgi:hypothetical protein
MPAKTGIIIARLITNVHHNTQTPNRFQPRHGRFASNCIARARIAAASTQTIDNAAIMPTPQALQKAPIGGICPVEAAAIAASRKSLSATAIQLVPPT